MFKHSPNGKGIMASMEYPLIIYSPRRRGFTKYCFPSGNRHGKRKERCTVKGTMSIKNSFVHYRNYIT